MTTLAEEAGLSAQQVRRLERGTASVAAVEAVAQALELRFSTLPAAPSLIGQIRAQRDRLGLSAVELATKAGVSRMTLRGVEAGAGSMASLDRVVAALVPAVRLKTPPRASWHRVTRGAGDQQFTPREFMERIESIFGAIDLDPCWHPMCSVTAQRTVSLEAGEDGLKARWEAGVVWLNPPYSKLLRWLRKADEEWSAGRAKTIVALVPVRTDSPYFHDRLVKIADIYLLRGRLRFLQLDGKIGNQAPFSMMLAVLGMTASQRAELERTTPGVWVLKPPR